MKLLNVLTCMLLLLVVGCKTTTNNTPRWEEVYTDNSDININVRLPDYMPDFTKDSDVDRMCWAIAVCNSLEYSGHVVDNRVCVLNMREEFGNRPGFALTAYNWYMRDILQLDPRDFYSRENNVVHVPDFVANEIDSGNPVLLQFNTKGNTPGGHVVAVYGYHEVKDGYDLYVVDGDDAKHTGIVSVRPHKFSWKIVSSGMYNKFNISTAFSISPATQ